MTEPLPCTTCCRRIGTAPRKAQGRPIYVERSASTNLAKMAEESVSVDDFVFTQVRVCDCNLCHMIWRQDVRSTKQRAPPHH